MIFDPDTDSLLADARCESPVGFRAGFVL